MDNRPKLICSERVRDPQSPQLFVPFCANVYAEGSVSDAQDTWHH